MSGLQQIHSYLCNKISIYQKWHEARPSAYVHIFILFFAFSLAISSTLNEIKLYQHVNASSNPVTNITKQNYKYTSELESDIALDYSQSNISQNGYLQLFWQSNQNIDYISIYLIDYQNQAQKLAKKIKNRNFFSAYLENPNYQIIQIVGYDQDYNKIASMHYQL